MSFDETDLIERLHAVAQGFEMPPAPLADDVRRGRRRVRRSRGLVAGAAAAAVVVALGVTAAVGGRAESERPEPVERPGIVVGDAPVWYDAGSLHRGDVVERTPEGIAVLALVRTGAVYLDTATDYVWFHPWGGEPRIVGHNSEFGPGGDPNGDIAVWFEGELPTSFGPGPAKAPGELVVYDTAAGREVSRTSQVSGVIARRTGDYTPGGNSFLQVSAEHVVWDDEHTIYNHDVLTGKTSAVTIPKGQFPGDVHNDVEVFGEGEVGSQALVLRVPGRADERYPELAPWARLSPSGNYVLAYENVDPYGVAILDTRTGEMWRVPKSAIAGITGIAWSYGDIALLDTGDELLTCDAARHTCEQLQPDRPPLLLPTN